MTSEMLTVGTLSGLSVSSKLAKIESYAGMDVGCSSKEQWSTSDALQERLGHVVKALKDLEAFSEVQWECRMRM